MATHKQKRAGRLARIQPALVVLLVLVVGGVVIGTCMLAGVDLPFFGTAQAGQRTDVAGKVAVPVAARPIAAYTLVRRDDLIQPETMEFAVVYIDAERARASGLITDAREILNRVLAHDKDRAYAFSEDDFLPKGTRAGPTAGIEPGMRGVRVPVDRVLGMHGLKRGDRFDLVAVQRLESDGPSRRDRSTVVDPKVAATDGVRRAWDASIRVLVQNGKVVEPVTARSEVSSAHKRVEEVMIAVPEAEVAALTQALAVGAEIQCLPRSGLPGGASTSMPEPEGPPPSNAIEVIAGDERRVTIVPNPDAEPSAAMDGSR